MTQLAEHHRALLVDLLARTREFTDDEVAVALELVDLGIAGSSEYRFELDFDAERKALRGYLCFGKTPMTAATYDLYWIAVDPDARGAGVGRALVERMEQRLRFEKGNLVRVETASADDYAGTRAFYDRIGYQTLARIGDFYARGNDLVIYGRYLTNAPKE